MHKITFGNQEYVRATEIAKQFRYTRDYVGQLCRSGKVDARLVGRNWYVVLESVTAYRKTKHQTQKSAVKHTTVSTKSSQPSKKPTKSVEPVQRAKTLRMVQKSAKQRRDQIKTVYDVDDEVLIPVLDVSGKKPVTATPARRHKPTVKIESRPAVTLDIQTNKQKPTTYTAEKLPEISLSGKLSVNEFAQEDAEAPKQDTAPHPDRTQISASKPEQETQNHGKVSAQPAPERVSKKSQSTPARESHQDRTPRSSRADTQSLNFTPAYVIDRTPAVRQMLLTLGVTTVVSGLIALGLFAVTAEVSVFDNDYQNSYNFDPANVRNLQR